VEPLREKTKPTLLTRMKKVSLLPPSSKTAVPSSERGGKGHQKEYNATASAEKRGQGHYKKRRKARHFEDQKKREFRKKRGSPCRSLQDEREKCPVNGKKPGLQSEKTEKKAVSEGRQRRDRRERIQKGRPPRHHQVDQVASQGEMKGGKIHLNRRGVEASNGGGGKGRSFAN